MSRRKKLRKLLKDFVKGDKKVQEFLVKFYNQNSKGPKPIRELHKVFPALSLLLLAPNNDTSSLDIALWSGPAEAMRFCLYHFLHKKFSFLRKNFLNSSTLQMSLIAYLELYFVQSQKISQVKAFRAFRTNVCEGTKFRLFLGRYARKIQSTYRPPLMPLLKQIEKTRKLPLVALPTLGHEISSINFFCQSRSSQKDKVETAFISNCLNEATSMIDFLSRLAQL